MRTLGYHESNQRGSPDFPLDYHYVDEHHTRYAMPYHWHEELELLHVRSGAFHMVIDDQVHLLRAGDVAFVAPGRLHGGKPEGCVYECVVLDMRLLLRGSDRCKQLIQDLLTRRCDVQPHLMAGEGSVGETLLPMFEALRQRSEGDELTTLGCLYRFAGEVYRRGCYTVREPLRTAEAASVLKLKTVFEMIEQRASDPPSLSELSAVVGLSPKYFCRFFKAATHRTPLDYIGFYRIEQACYEMMATEKNATEIAQDMGYEDLNYFIRCFKKYKGITPKQYMLRMKRGGAEKRSSGAEGEL